MQASIAYRHVVARLCEFLHPSKDAAHDCSQMNANDGRGAFRLQELPDPNPVPLDMPHHVLKPHTTCQTSILSPQQATWLWHAGIVATWQDPTAFAGSDHGQLGSKIAHNKMRQFVRGRAWLGWSVLGSHSLCHTGVNHDELGCAQARIVMSCAKQNCELASSN